MTRVFARSILEKLHQRRSAGVRGMAGPRARGGRGVLAFRTKGETRRNAREGGGGEGRRATSDERSASPPKKSVCVQSHFLPSLCTGTRVTFADQPSSGESWDRPAGAPRRTRRGRGHAARRSGSARRARSARAARARPLPLPRLRVARVAGRGDARARRSRLPPPASRRARSPRAPIDRPSRERRWLVRGRFPAAASGSRVIPAARVSGFRISRAGSSAGRPPIPLAFARVRPARAHARAQESKLARGLSEEKRDSAGVVVRAAGSRARRWPKKSRALNSSSGD